jgi:cell division inhibitor SulA/protein ImuA
LFFVLAAADVSPAELRVAVRPVEDGVSVDIVKRKGPKFEGDVMVRFRPGATLMSPQTRRRRTVVPFEILILIGYRPTPQRNY